MKCPRGDGAGWDWEDEDEEEEEEEEEEYGDEEEDGDEGDETEPESGTEIPRNYMPERHKSVGCRDVAAVRQPAANATFAVYRLRTPSYRFKFRPNNRNYTITFKDDEEETYTWTNDPRGSVPLTKARGGSCN
ncbi:MAG: hypothetical protein L3J24_13345 [Xanthomonadales bacterium]|nr:hypothetical protein [Xanthomonadales bacterium]